MSAYSTAGVIGAGAWGTALAQVCARAGLGTRLWAREAEVAASIRERRENTLFLPGVALHEAVAVTGDLGDLVDCDIILAVPAPQPFTVVISFNARGDADGVFLDRASPASQCVARNLARLSAPIPPVPDFAEEIRFRP